MCKRSIGTDIISEFGRLQSAISTPGGSIPRTRHYSEEKARRVYRAKLEVEQKELIANAPEPSIATTYGSHMRYFFGFCDQTGVDPGKFSTKPHSSPRKLQE